MIHQNVADLTVDEFKELVREVVAQTILEMFSDPDEGLDLREEMTTVLRRSVAAVQAGGEITPAEAVATRLGLDW